MAGGWVGEDCVGVGGAAPEGGGGWEEAEGFFEDGECVVEFVDDVGVGFDVVSDGGRGCSGAEDGREFGG